MGRVSVEARFGCREDQTTEDGARGDGRAREGLCGGEKEGGAAQRSEKGEERKNKFLQILTKYTFGWLFKIPLTDYA